MIIGFGGHLGHVSWTIYINFIPSSQYGSISNLALIGPAVSEEKTFDIVDDDNADDNDLRRTMGILLAHLRAFGQEALLVYYWSF